MFIVNPPTGINAHSDLFGAFRVWAQDSGGEAAGNVTALTELLLSALSLEGARLPSIPGATDQGLMRAGQGISVACVVLQIR